jgi:hypothetical protein
MNYVRLHAIIDSWKDSGLTKDMGSIDSSLTKEMGSIDFRLTKDMGSINSGLTKETASIKSAPKTISINKAQGDFMLLKNTGSRNNS